MGQFPDIVIDQDNICGILGPVAGALVHNAGSVVVIANSVFLLKWRRKNA